MFKLLYRIGTSSPGGFNAIIKAKELWGRLAGRFIQRKRRGGPTFLINLALGISGAAPEHGSTTFQQRHSSDPNNCAGNLLDGFMF